MGFGRAGFYFWYELPGRLQLLGQRFIWASKMSARASISVLSETFSTFTSFNFEPYYPDPDPVGNLLGSDPKKIQ